MNLHIILITFLRVALGATFIFSGVIKLYPIEPFELNFIDIGLADWITASILARLLISLEIFLGVMLIINFFTRTVLLLTIALLMLFSIYLLWAMYAHGDQGNCGCFGTFLEMTPMESLYKNSAMLLVAVFLYKMNKPFYWKYARITTCIIAMSSISFSYIINPPDFLASSNMDIENVGYKLDTKYLGDYNFSGQKPDFSKGKHILAFFLTTCPHCKLTALKLSVLKRKYALPPVYAVIAGKEKKLAEFLSESKWDLPYYYYTNKDLLKLSGPDFPAIFYIKDGIVTAKWNNLMMNEQDIQAVLK
ncbi:MAG: DoxX family membrane protein [Cytophagaceae bacterium]|nr:DoxX family membrane protein [Cytophagaceae bacterium]MDW8456886.1 DoxX family membrane protein [Cytophagaceae bacterium]